MRTRVFFTILSILLICACAGVRARESVLLPAMRAAWEGISADVGAGIVDLAASGTPASTESLRAAADVARALQAGDVAQVAAARWDIVEPIAQRGIDARLAKHEIGPGVAASLRERVRKFTEAWVLLGAR